MIENQGQPRDTSDPPPGGESAKKAQVVVLGDIYWDSVAIHTKPGLLRCDRPAGAWLLQRFLCHVKAEIDRQFEIKGYPYPQGYITDKMTGCGLETAASRDRLELSTWLRAASRAKLFPKGSGEKPEDKVYRLEQSFGFVDDLEWRDDDVKNKYEDLNHRLQGLTDCNQRIIVINDNPIIIDSEDSAVSKASFRLCSNIKETIEKLADVEKLNKKLPEWNATIVLSIKRKIAESDVLDVINRNPDLRNRTAVIVSAAHLRSEGHNVPSTLALETQASDLWSELDKGPLKILMACRHVLIHDPESVFHFDNTNITGTFSLYCRPYVGGPENNPGRYGKMSGYVKIIIAKIVSKMLRAKSDILFDDIEEGICDGLKLWQKHFERGLLPEECPPKEFIKDNLWHPFDELLEKANIEKNKSKIAFVRFPLPEYFNRVCPAQAEEKFKKWSRVDWFVHKKGMETFEKLLFDVVKGGADAIENKYLENGRILCPVAKIGKIKSVDRDEINGLIDIYKLIIKYLQDQDDKRPMSLAIFGPPGTGKSSTVKKIVMAARSATAKGGGGEALTCNLSQLTDPENLTAAFHQAQDRALAEEVPLVFFDEFDTDLPGQPYGWLKYFLAPMEDGTFKAANSNESYRVGKAIFAFAGGTAETFQKFQENVGEKKEVKGPDFISRLRGFLNVRSINMEKKDEPVSNLLALRRAIILNSILNDVAKGVLDPLGKVVRIENDLINAFLQIKEYRHGIRSMVAIVQMSRPEGGRLQVASLPSRPQLRMHVDDAEFLELTAISSPNVCRHRL